MIQEEPISWLIDRVVGFEKIASSDFVKKTTAAGGFFAGGFPRKLLRDGSTSGLSRFFTSHDDVVASDIDIFCRTFDAIEQLKGKDFWHPSFGKNALQRAIHDTQGLFIESGNGVIQLQLITCVVGTPEAVISDFDFTNCQVAFDANRVWFNPEMLELEKQKTLKLSGKEKYTGSRVLKYLKKHDYARLCPSSRMALLAWLSNRDKAKDWDQFQGGMKVLPLLAAFGPDVIPDDFLINFIGRFYSSKKLLGLLPEDYSNLGTRSAFYAGVDEVKLELQKRKPEKFSSGDMVNVVMSSPPHVGPAILLVPATHDDSPLPNVWEVLFSDGDVIKLHESMFAQMLMPFEQCEHVQP